MADAMQKPAGGTPAMSGLVAIAICFSIAVLEGFDIQAMGVTASKIGPHLHLAKEQMGWVFAASNIGLVIGATFGGWIADKLGRKPVLVASVVIFGIFTLATGFAPDYVAMLAARLLCGLGLGAAMPNMMAISAEVSPPGQRASTATMMFCGMPVGGASAALFTASLGADFDYKTVFMVGGILPLIVVPLILWRLTETKPDASEDHERVDNALQALFGGGRAKASILLWIAFVPTLLILYLMLNWLPTLVGAKGLGGPAGPQASLFFNVGSVIGALILGRIVDRMGPRIPVVAAYVALVAAMIGLSMAQGFAPVMAMSALVGFFCLGAQYVLYGVAPQYYPPAFRATGSGASVAMGRVGSIIGPLVGGFLGTSQVLPALAPLAVVAGLAVLLLTLVAKPRTD